MPTKKAMAELLRNIKAGKININDAITKAETTSRMGKYTWEIVGKEGQAVKLESGFVYQVRNGEIFRIAEIQKRTDGKLATFQVYFNKAKAEKKNKVNA